jgi:hypothetical protein
MTYTRGGFEIHTCSFGAVCTAPRVEPEAMRLALPELLLAFGVIYPGLRGVELLESTGVGGVGGVHLSA